AGTTNSPSIVTINECSFEKNSAYRGGALHILGASSVVKVYESSYTGNTTSQQSSFGAAVHITAGKLDIVNTSFVDNRAGGTGGAIYHAGSNTELNIIRSLFSNNRSSGSGGAACFANGTVNISSSLFSGNSSTHTGRWQWAGAINILDAIEATVTGTTVYGNTTAGKGGGGAINTAGNLICDVKVHNSIFFANTATDIAAPGTSDVANIAG